MLEQLDAFSKNWADRLASTMAPLPLRIIVAPGEVRAEGDPVAARLTADVFRALATAMKHSTLAPRDIRSIAARAVDNALRHDLTFRLEGLPHPLRPLSVSQFAFMNALIGAQHALIFGAGPTGTGKTHLAIAAGLHLVATQRYHRMVITRPRVLLEGEVMTPALRAETAADEQLTPIEDVLVDLISFEEVRRQMDHGLIEIVPLGRLRGRSLNDCYIVIDEAHNLTQRKMRMALSRLGRRSRMVVVGDPDQSDLPGDELSGLSHVLQMIEGESIAYVHHFSARQIIRNEIVARLEALYQRDETGAMEAAA